MNFLQKFWARLTTSKKLIYGPRRAFWVRGETVVDEDSSMRVAAFNRGLVYISTQIAKLPWNIKDSKNEIVEGSLSNLLNLSPNSEMNAFMFRVVMTQNAIIHGNSYAEIERDGLGRIIALWPLESWRMELIRDDSYSLLYRYADESKGYVYFRPRDIFHIKNFHTKDGLVGQGVSAYGREVLGIQLAADTMASGIFHNSGIPSGILSHPGKLSDEAFKRLQETWINDNGGKKSGGTSVLEEGMKYDPIKIDATTLQFLESRQFGVLEIARFLGLPPTKLFDTQAATYSNVEQANLEVATDTLDTWATNFEMEADVKILSNRFGDRYTDIDLYSIFRGDMKSRSDYFKTMMSIGAITPNQIRAREGMPAYKEGDNYYIATNNFTPVDRLDEVIDADIKQKTKPATSPNESKPKDEPKTSELENAALKYLTGGK
jgi:HK97 family phage portal protein